MALLAFPFAAGYCAGCGLAPTVPDRTRAAIRHPPRLLADVRPASALHVSITAPTFSVPAMEIARPKRRVRTSQLGMRLLAGALRWGVSTAGDGAILAFTSPAAFRMLNDWRRTCYGEIDQLTTTLEEASEKLAHHVRFTTGVAAHVEHRAKGLLSTFTKSVAMGKKPRDVMALRLVLPDADPQLCYDAMAAVYRLWQPSLNRDDYKDYVASPKPNGYQAIHDTVRLPSGRLMEVQIRTASMHAHAEHGEASHEAYKGSIGRLFGAIGGLGGRC
jgi:GTP pyrophosphokinase